MMSEEVFIKDVELPEPLSKDELIILFKKKQNGDKEARKIIIEHNLKLVIDKVLKNYGHLYGIYDQNDLIQEGIIGLMSAVDTYDLSRQMEFSSYAVPCILNSVRMYLRKLSRHQEVEHLEEAVYQSKDGGQLKEIDRLKDSTNVEEDVLNIEIQDAIKSGILQVKKRERELTLEYFGLFGREVKNQRELSSKYGLERSYICRLISGVKEVIRDEFERKELTSTYSMIETNKEELDIENRNKWKEKVLIQKKN